MERQDVQELLMMITTTFPSFKVQNKTATIDSWLFFLSEYDKNDILLALKSFVQTSGSEFAPNPSQLIGELEKVHDLAQKDVSEAWAMVRKAIGRGTYHAQEEFDKLPESIKKAVGSADLLYCWATDPNYSEGVIMSQFKDNYKRVLERQKELRRLPKELQNRIGQYVEKVPKLEDGAIVVQMPEENFVEGGELVRGFLSDNRL